VLILLPVFYHCSTWIRYQKNSTLVLIISRNDITFVNLHI
jgi:hypothetical protein